MLQGTFETLPLPELLGLLGHSGKTGALWLEAGPATAALYLKEGRCCAAQSGDVTGRVDDAASLLVRIVDLCFAAARTDDGAFRFGREEPPWVCNESVHLDVAIDELTRLLDEWREIQNVIPSLDCRIRLAEELGSDGIVVDPERWRLIVAIDGRHSVRELVRKCNRPVLDVCHALLALVDAGAAAVVPVAVATAPTASRAGKAGGPRPSVDPETPWGPGVESVHPGPRASAPEDQADDSESEKGQFLRALSGLRD